MFGPWIHGDILRILRKQPFGMQASAQGRKRKVKENRGLGRLAGSKSTVTRDIELLRVFWAILFFSLCFTLIHFDFVKVVES